MYGGGGGVIAEVHEGQQGQEHWSVCALCYQRGLVTFNVLAALATGGLGVSGLEPACGLPYPTPAPPGMSPHGGRTMPRHDGRTCAINEGRRLVKSGMLMQQDGQGVSGLGLATLSTRELRPRTRAMR